jgi:hypothetical protein
LETLLRLDAVASTVTFEIEPRAYNQDNMQADLEMTREPDRRAQAENAERLSRS